MLRSCVVSILGILMSGPVIILLFFRFLKRGFSVFQVKSRPVPPTILREKRYGEHKFVTVNGVKLHYVESGDERKPLILFVHGFPEFWFSWRHQILHFQKNFHVVALDMRGYGESSKPEGINSYLMENLILDIKELVTALGKSRFHLVAHDWGGAIAWYFASKYPEMIQTFIPCNIPHPLALRDQLNNNWAQRLKSWYILFFQCPVLPELFCLSSDMAMMKAALSDANITDGEIIEAFKYTFQTFQSWNRTINYYRANMVKNNRSLYKLQDIKVPTLLIFGTADKYLSVESAQGSARYVSDMQLELLEGVSHWVQQEAPDTVNSLIQKFISSRN